MIKNEWVNFSIYDLTDNEETIYTQEKFEEMVDDKFIALEIKEEDKPIYIWTEKYAFSIHNFVRMIGQLSIVGVPRNPDWQ
jgi:hypothetical protein